MSDIWRKFGLLDLKLGQTDGQIARVDATLVHLDDRIAGLDQALQKLTDRVERTEFMVTRLFRRDEEWERARAEAQAAAVAANLSLVSTFALFKSSAHAAARGFAQNENGFLSLGQGVPDYCSLVGSVALPTDMPFHWAAEIPVRTDGCHLGVTLNSDPAPICCHDAATYTWGSGSYMRVAGACTSGDEGWPGFASGDILALKFDPARRVLSVHHSRHRKVYHLEGIAAGPVYLLVDLYSNDTRVRMRAATVAEVELLTDPE